MLRPFSACEQLSSCSRNRRNYQYVSPSKEKVMRNQALAVLALLAIPCIPSARSQQAVQEPAAATPVAASLPTPFQDPSGKYIFLCETPIHLAIARDFDGKKSAVGNKVPLVLAEDLIAGNMLFAKKGAPVDATVLEVIRPRPGGAPGLVRFQVHSFLAGNTIVFLHGTETREGQVRAPGASVLIPVVGSFIALRRGDEAVIKKGSLFTAFLAQDTLLAPLS